MVEIAHVNFASDDPAELADFWAEALDAERLDLLDELGLEIVEVPDGPNLMLREAPRGTDRGLPIHLDLHAEDRESEVERLEGLGAMVRETKTDEEHDTVWTVMEDLAGNGFCVSGGG